jgi:hypothetical protein
MRIKIYGTLVVGSLFAGIKNLDLLLDPVEEASNEGCIDNRQRHSSTGDVLPPRKLG